MKVLVVDDDPVSRHLARALVEALGHAVETATDGEQAWELVQRGTYDVLLTDREMPGLDGVTLCRRLRERAAPSRLLGTATSHAAYCYVVLVTGHDSDTEALEGLVAGADDYLGKPLDAGELRRRLLVAQRVTDLHQRLQRQHVVLAELGQAQHALARRDALTLLPNRLALQEHLDRLDAGSRRSDRRYSIAMVDVDHFKSYNDAVGHAAADEVLRRLVHAMAAQVRRSEALYRYGGEEFVHVSEADEPGAALAATDRLRLAVRDLALPHPGRGTGVVTVSAGVATSSPGTSSSTLLEAADTALYQAKHTGRDRTVHATAHGLPLPRRESGGGVAAPTVSPPDLTTGATTR